MGILKEAIAKGGSYTTRDGTEKTRFVKVGALLSTKNGEALKLDALPVNFDGWIYLKDPLPKDEPKGVADMSSDVPF